MLEITLVKKLKLYTIIMAVIDGAELSDYR
jgi:hypothetical protein